SAGVRSFDDCREYFWAGADAVSLGSEVWLAPYWGYALGPLRGVLIQRLIRRVETYERDERGAWARHRRGGSAAGQFSPALGRTVETLRQAGLEVLAALGVVDREQGGAAAFAGAGVPYQALFTKTELGL